MEIVLPNHKYIFQREFPIEDLEYYTKHHRLKLYIKKGFICENCGVVCDRLIQGKPQKCQAYHTDLYNKDLTRMLTVGHIIPKSKGGKWVLDNLRPLCHVCNTKEGTCIARLCADPLLFDAHLNGKTVKRMSGKPFVNGNETAIINRVFISKHNKGNKHKDMFVFGFSDNSQTYPANKVCFID